MREKGSILRLKTSTIALEIVGGQRTAHMIPEGAIVEIANASEPDDRMVDILYDDRHMTVFEVDLKARGEVVKSASGVDQ